MAYDCIWSGNLSYYNSTEGDISLFPCGDNDTSSENAYDWDYYYDVKLPTRLRNFVYPAPHEWFLISVYALVFLMALVGNVLVCFAVLRNQQMRTVTNYYIVNLSFADILVSLICLPVTVTFETTETWYFGDLACKIIPYVQVVSMSVSVLTLSAIAVDRYFAICQPLLFKSTAKRTLTIIFSIWLVSFIIPIPQAIVYETEAADTYKRTYIYFTKCYEKVWFGTIQQKIYHVALVLVIYVIPLLLIGIAYLFICRQLWATIPGTMPSGGGKHCHSNGSDMNRTTMSQLKSRRKVANMLIIVAILFALCYLPLHLLNIIRQFPIFDEVVQEDRHSFHIPFLVAHWLAFANSATNPVVYNFLSAKFRKEFKAAFTCCLSCCARKRRRRHKRGGYQGSIMHSSMASTSKSYGNCTEHISMSTVRTGVHV
ncbi:orexin/Hypocretin receptor type 1-like [Saccoglossus kowalevskii]|uniref:Orexin receptor type 2-like n=1 Tax=Saccoglossus kowalevskii TaxID=10224 RepID=A0ABM0GN51_SACKO|nr:PREDICTED: orexin receptor type 2-like [Saccoglossus kowalevskii]